MKISNSLKSLMLWQLAVPMALLVLGVYHGLIQTLYRAGFIQDTSFFGLEYYQGLTIHGVVNAIVLTTFFAVAFGHATVIYYLKVNLNKTVAWISGALMFLGTGMAAWAMLVGKASVLYTFYPPMKAHPAFYIGLVLVVVGSWIASFQWFHAYNGWRKANKGKKTPLAVFATLTNFIIWLICTLPVAVELLFFLIPWSFGWVDGVNVMLMRTLFWFFGHPLVYFWLIPAYIGFYVFVPKLAGGKLYSDKVARLVFVLFILFSIPVGLHHQFAEPAISRGLKLMHSIFTFGVAVPSLLTAFTIAASLEYAARLKGGKGLLSWFGKLPYLDRDNYLFAYLISGLFIFIFGGFTGIVNASYSMNMVVHNTAYQPGHFHMTVAGPVLLAIWGISLHMLAKLKGKEIKFKNLNVLVPYLWLIGLFFFSSGLMMNGVIGSPRRTNLGMSYLDPDSPLYRPELLLGVLTTVLGGIVMTISALFYFMVFFGTLFSKKVREPALDFPTSEAYHDEKNIGLLDKFKPWIIIAILLILIAYIPAIREATSNSGANAPTYNPDSAVPTNEMVEQ